jgi:hypothetical protein
MISGCNLDQAGLNFLSWPIPGTMKKLDQHRIPWMINSLVARRVGASWANK